MAEANNILVMSHARLIEGKITTFGGERRRCRPSREHSTPSAPLLSKIGVDCQWISNNYIELVCGRGL